MSAALISPGDAQRRSRPAAVATTVAALLIAGKLAAAIATNSMAILASLVDSAMDVVASGANFLALRHAAQPPDADHRWGHGKAESLSGLVQTSVIAASAVTLLWQSLDRIITLRALERPTIGIWVMGVSVAASLALTLYLRRAARRYDSVALEADSLHYASDVWSGLGTIAALWAYEFLDLPWLDPVVSVVIAGIIGQSAYRIGRRSVDQLMDHELPEELRLRIREVALGVSPDVRDVHELRTRRSGQTTVVEMHLEMRGDLSFVEAHRITEAARSAIEAMFEHSIITIHADPDNQPDAERAAGSGP